METNDKKNSIIQAAIRVLDKENYQNMKTARVAEEAGISEGTIYRYFENKRALFIEVLRFITDRLAQLLLSGANPENSIKENFITLADNFFKRSDESDLLYKIYYKAFSEVDDAEIKPVIAEIYLKSIEAVKNVIKQNAQTTVPAISDGQLERAVMLLWGIGDILWKRDIVLNNPKISTDEIEPMVDMLLKALS